VSATKLATSHAGIFDGFEVFWIDPGVNCDAGWYVGIPDSTGNKCYGPFATSQAAFGAVKGAIDLLLEKEG
jgi:hypothetical protein